MNLYPYNFSYEVQMLKQFTDNNLLIHEKESSVTNKNLKDRNSQTKSKRVDKKLTIKLLMETIIVIII